MIVEFKKFTVLKKTRQPFRSHTEVEETKLSVVGILVAIFQDTFN